MRPIQKATRCAWYRQYGSSKVQSNESSFESTGNCNRNRIIGTLKDSFCSYSGYFDLFVTFQRGTDRRRREKIAFIQKESESSRDVLDENKL